MLVHISTSDLANLMMILDQLETQEGMSVRSLVMPRWEIEAGRPVFEERYAANAYLVVDARERTVVEAWWEEWADYVRTDLKHPFADEEYAWIEAQRRS